MTGRSRHAELGALSDHDNAESRRRLEPALKERDMKEGARNLPNLKYRPSAGENNSSSDQQDIYDNIHFNIHQTCPHIIEERRSSLIAMIS